jgi:hypothetical protein
MGSVLYIAAHRMTEYPCHHPLQQSWIPDGFLSLTRDGSQNLLGPQFGEQLGVARPGILAARRLDEDDSTSRARKTSGFRRIIRKLCGYGIGRKSWLTSSASSAPSGRT